MTYMSYFVYFLTVNLCLGFDLNRLELTWGNQHGPYTRAVP